MMKINGTYKKNTNKTVKDNVIPTFSSVLLHNIEAKPERQGVLYGIKVFFWWITAGWFYAFLSMKKFDTLKEMQQTLEEKEIELTKGFIQYRQETINLRDEKDAFDEKVKKEVNHKFEMKVRDEVRLLSERVQMETTEVRLINEHENNNLLKITEKINVANRQLKTIQENTVDCDRKLTHLSGEIAQRENQSLSLSKEIDKYQEKLANIKKDGERHASAWIQDVVESWQKKVDSERERGEKNVSNERERSEKNLAEERRNREKNENEFKVIINNLRQQLEKDHEKFYGRIEQLRRELTHEFTVRNDVSIKASENTFNRVLSIMEAQRVDTENHINTIVAQLGVQKETFVGVLQYLHAENNEERRIRDRERARGQKTIWRALENATQPIPNNVSYVDNRQIRNSFNDGNVADLSERFPQTISPSSPPRFIQNSPT